MSPAARVQAWSKIFLIVLVLGLLVRCSSPLTPPILNEKKISSASEIEHQEHVSELAHPSMGTLLNINLAAWGPVEFNHPVVAEALQAVDHIEAVFSHYQPGSEINRLQRTPVGEVFPPSPEMKELFLAGKALAVQTDGFFSMNLYGLLWRKGFFPAAQPDSHNLDKEALVPDSIRLNGQGNLQRFHGQSGLDFDGLAKGYALDRAADILQQEFSWGVLGYGSTNISWGQGNQQVVLENPLKGQSGILDGVVCEIPLGVGVSTSSCRENTREGVCHILDPKSFQGVTHSLLQVTVVVENATLADGLSTALMAMGPVDGVKFLERQNIKGVLVAGKPHPGFSPGDGVFIYVSSSLRGHCSMTKGQEFTEP